jgi:hypothetical protein
MQSVFSLLRSLFGKQKGDSSPAVYSYGIDNLNDDVIGDLPDPQGIPLVQTRVIIERMQREIAFIKSEIGLNQQEFDKYFVPTCIAFIEFADLLPASEYKHHATGGGLIYHSFDVAKRGMRAAQHTQFPCNSGIYSDTQRSRKQWKVATVLGCLLHDSGKVITDMVVSNGKDGDHVIKWDSHDKSISKWAEQHQIDRYFVSWNKDRHKKHQAASLTSLQRLIPKETWSWINSAPEGQFIHNCLLGFLSDTDGENPIARIVAECDAESVRQDMFHNRSQITKQMKRIPVSELLADIMRFNILERKWSINSKNSKVWYIDDELYITWESAVPEMIDEVIKGGFSIPEVPSILAKIMIEEGMASGESDDPYHTIYPIVLGDKAKPVHLRCLKINNPGRVIPRLNKVYPIEQHATGAAGKAQEKAKVAEKPVSSASDFTPAEPIPEHKPTYETSIETITRVLGIMKADQNKVPDENKLPVSYYPTNNVVESMEAEPVQEEKAEQPESSEPTTAQKQVVIGNPIAEFISDNFDFEVINNIIHLPESEIDKVAMKLIASGVPGVNDFNAINSIKSNEMISIYR